MASLCQPSALSLVPSLRWPLRGQEGGGTSDLALDVAALVAEAALPLTQLLLWWVVVLRCDRSEAEAMGKRRRSCCCVRKWKWKPLA